MALALRSSTSFIKLKDIKNSKNIDDFSGMVCYAQIKPSCHLRSRKLMQVACQIPHDRSSPFEMGRSDQKREKIHGLSRSHSKSDSSVPVFVMLPLDTVSFGRNLNKPRVMNASLMALKGAGVKVVMVDVWWGLVEKDGPSKYNWEGYAELVKMVKKHGMKLQVVMSFHQCGGNVGDSCRIPLPPWVLEEMSKNPDLVYTDRSGRRNPEYISLGCDSLPVLRGRTPIQVYSDYMRSFGERFKHYLGDVIEEIQVGMGPCGELRYPAYPESNGIWNFPGNGGFQCYDKYMRASLEASADAAGNKDGGQSGPHDAGQYNNFPEDTKLFLKDGTWNSKYGKFFLEWYSRNLIEHGDRILAAAQGIFQGTGAKVSGKIAGIHWHYRTRSHAMELIAGYYNTRHQDGYLPLARMLGNHRVVLNFTCMDIRDRVLPENANCSPEGLVQQVKMGTKTSGTQLAGQNALEKYDGGASAQVLATSRSDSGNVSSAFTYLRMNKNLFEAENWQNLVEFMKSMQEGGRDTRFIRK